jgi:hypothetical protein
MQLLISLNGFVKIAFCAQFQEIGIAYKFSTKIIFIRKKFEEEYGSECIKLYISSTIFLEDLRHSTASI